ncbi:MAG: hypothetical protein A2X86_11685 [Bdellovibrionales bacterium GWA2_49_15]|nr:MAG: hypothetical protein A2X86_11685 [Bdellovibrionales bacterium GWA2_49_15]
MALKFICLLAAFTLFSGYQLVTAVYADEEALPASNLTSDGAAAWTSMGAPPTGDAAAAAAAGAGGADSSEDLMTDTVPTGTDTGASGQQCLGGTAGPFKGHKDCIVPASARPDQCALDKYMTSIEAIRQNGNEVYLGSALDKARIQRVGKGKKLTLGRLCFLRFIQRARIVSGYIQGTDINLTKLGIEPQTGTKTKPVPLPDTFNVTPSERSEEGLYPGGDFFKMCQRIDYNGTKGFNQLVKDKTPFTGSDEQQTEFRGEYTTILREFQGKITASDVLIDINTEDGAVAGKLSSYADVLTDYGRKLKELFSKSRRCTAGRNLVKAFIDWSDSDQTKKPADKASFDGKIKCKSEGPETQDYWSCAATVDAYNVAEIADKGITTIQQIDFMNKQTEVQTDVMIQQKDDVTAALKGQRDMVKKQAEVAHIAGTVDLAKAAALASKMSSIPTISDIINSCNTYLPTANTDKVQKDNYNAVLAILQYHIIFFNFGKEALAGMGNGAGSVNDLRVNQIFPAYDSAEYAGTGENAVDLCANVAANSGMNLAMNGPAKDAAKAAMIAAGLEGIANQAKGIILTGQADKIDDAIDGMNKFKPELPTFGSQDVMVQKCQADPSLPECSQFGFNRDIGFAGNSFNIDGMANGTSDASSLGSGESNNANATGNSGDTNRSGVVQRIGGSVGGINKASGLEGTVGAARFKNGGAGGGGGGGGTPGSMAAPGGGGGGDGAGGGGAGGGAVRNGSTGYEGGGARLAYGGGAGGGKSSGKPGEENPFAKLFGKKDEGGNSSLDFGRGPASVGGQGANIFGMISNRYQQVNGSKRLLEYEAK